MPNGAQAKAGDVAMPDEQRREKSEQIGTVIEKLREMKKAVGA